MPDDLAPANVNRAYSLSGTSIAIFTFTLTFLFPRFANGEINDVLFQIALIVLGVATFSFVFTVFLYYAASLGSVFSDADREKYSRRGDRLWLLGFSLLFLDPSLILASVGLVVVGAVWFALWLAYLAFAVLYFPRIHPSRKSPLSGETDKR